jgi:hypothetical protein
VRLLGRFGRLPGRMHDGPFHGQGADATRHPARSGAHPRLDRLHQTKGHGPPPTSAPQCTPPNPDAGRHTSNPHHADPAPAANTLTTAGDSADADETALDGTTWQATYSDDPDRTRGQTTPPGTIEFRSMSDRAGPCQGLGSTSQHAMTRSGTIRTRADPRGRTRTIIRGKTDGQSANHDCSSGKPPLQQPTDGSFPLPVARIAPPEAPDRWRANGERAHRGPSDTRRHDPNLDGRSRTRAIWRGWTIRHRPAHNGTDQYKMASI